MTFSDVDLSDTSTKLYVNGGVHGNGKEGSRNISAGTMETNAVANNVVIRATNSKFYLLGVGGSGSTKVVNGSVELEGCSVDSLFLSGINGEVVSSTLVMRNCDIDSFAATNRGFVGTASVSAASCTIENLEFGATNGCFSSDSGTSDGSGITGSSTWSFDNATTVTKAVLTPLIKKGGDGASPTYTMTTQGTTIEKDGNSLSVQIEEFKPSVNPSVVLPSAQSVTVPENNELNLKNVRLTVESGQMLDNMGSIVMDENSVVSISSGAKFGDAGTVIGGELTIEEGATKIEYAARTGSVGYDTLQAAIDAAANGGTVTLLKNVNENVTVGEDDNIVLDLNGFKLTNDASSNTEHTITNRGLLAIADGSQAKTGVVDNVSHAKAALWNDPGAEATLFGGTYTRSKENGQSATDSEGNSYYNLVNHGTMTINEGVTVAQDGAFSSMVENGWYNGKDNTNNVRSVMTINGGTFTGGLNTIKNDDWGVLTINGGTFENVAQACVLNWNETTINDGSFQSDKDVILNGSVSGNEQTMDKGILTISGGTFVAGDGEVIERMSESSDAETRTIQGGTFNKTPISSMADKDYVVRVDGEDSFTVMRKGSLGPGTYQTIEDDELTADDFQPGLSVTVDGNGNFVATRPYVPPAPSGERVTVAEADGGSVSVDPERADEGEVVTITATPDEGQEVRTVQVTGEDGGSVDVRAGEDGTWEFEMPDGAVTVTVTFGCDGGALCPTHGFADVDQSAWYHDAVDWAVESGVLNGYGDGGELLGPVATITRAEMAQVLWNRAGRPEAEADLSGLSDVDAEGGWYAPAVAWCVSEGVFSGYGDTFGTERVISREEAATVLWRASGEPGPEGDLSGYADAGSVSEYATDAMAWAVSEGVLEGKGGVSLDPQGGCTRGEVAAMLMRMAG